MGLTSKKAALFSCAALIALSLGSAAWAAPRNFDVPAQDAVKAIPEFGRQAGVQVIAPADKLKGIRTLAVRGSMEVSEALALLVRGIGLEVASNDGRVIVLRAANETAPPSSTTRRTDAAQEQQDEKPTASVEKVTVTGTRIRGSNRFAPVQKYTRNDLDRAGQGSTGDFVAKLPQNFGGGVSPTNVGPGSGAGPGSVALNLRGLGNASTLTLVNGRRLAPSGISGRFADVSTIPASAIERIEVLTDGASAIYGSDAVAGVVNFILRTDFDGAETRARYANITTGDASDFQIAQTFGVASETGNALMSYQYTHADPLLLRDKDGTLPASDTGQLLPETRQHAIFASGSLFVAERTRLSADVFWNERKTDQVWFNPFALTTYTDNAYVRQLNAAASLEHDLDSWSLSLTPTFGATRYHNRNGDGTIFAGFDDSSRSDVFTLDGVAEGVLFTTDGGETRAAFGAHWRRETYEGLTVFPDGFVSFQDSNDRTVSAVFGEVVVPIVGDENRSPLLEALSLSLALRYDNYSDAGSSTVPKLGVAYTPFEGFTLRSSYGRSFKAPYLSEQTDNIISANIVHYVDPEAPTGTSVALFIGGTRSDLSPERAESLSFGIDYEPSFIENLLLRVTGYEVEYTDRVAAPGVGFVFDPAFPPFDFAYQNFTSSLVRNPTLPILQDYFNRAQFPFNFTLNDLTDVTVLIDGRTLNAAFTKTSGIDLNADYRFAIGDVPFSWSLNANYIFTFDNQVVAGGPVQSELDRVFKPTDLRARSGLSAAVDDLQLSAFVNYVDDYVDDLSNARVPSWRTLDMSLRYEFTESGSLLEGFDLTLAATNVFDEDPPRLAPTTVSGGGPSFRALSFDSANADPTGRKVSIQLTKRW